jgi:hypothetical protein
MKIRITAEQLVKYDQIKEISDERYQQWLSLAENEDADQTDIHNLADLIIDYADVTDADELQDVEIHPYVDKD